MDHTSSNIPSKRGHELDQNSQNSAVQKNKRQDVYKNSAMDIDEDIDGSDDQLDSHSDIGSPSYSQQGHHVDNDSIWQKTVEKVVKSVVSIHFAQTANFDSEPSLVSEATGFVVDSVRGLILTNRHVVGAGPFVGYAVFDNHEECEVKPIYRDPVHDFGFLQFDPKGIKYMEVQDLELRPELAKVGCEIRVIGNDSGEKLSILAGFISRLDRNSPDYGGMTFNDFNTEYIQAAASASGGSSGSPVVNIDGNVVALQAGGSTESSTDFFLPVYRVSRALKCIQNGEPVTRGSIQVQWALKPFDKCQRLGLRQDTEKRMREKFPALNGLLVAEVVLPQGPADTLIREGDCLISINNIDISTFITVDDILDSSVGKVINVTIQRGGEDISCECVVGNLHDITPDRYLTVAGASFNSVSYQMARLYDIPVKGVFLNDASGSFLFDENERVGWILDLVDEKETPDLDTFIEIMKQIPDETWVSIQCRHLTDLHVPRTSVACIRRRWNPEMRMATRNDTTGLWDFETLQEHPLPPKTIVPHNAKFIDIPTDLEGCASMVRSFALVGSTIPFPLDAYPGVRGKTYGLVVDAAKGYLVVSRYAIPHDMVDIHVTIAESIVVPGKVIFLHPSKGYAIVKYDPSLVLAPVTTPKFSKTPLLRGDKVIFVGYNMNYRVVTDETKVSDVACLGVPSNPTAPRYRGTNLEGLQIDSNLSSQCGSGVLCDTDGTVRALWLTYLGERTGDCDAVYRLGLDITEINPIIEELSNGRVPDLRMIDAEFTTISIAVARVRGVPEEWIQKMEEDDSGKDRLQFIMVLRSSAQLSGKPSVNLVAGDTVLAINGKRVSRFRDLDVMHTSQEMTFTVVRRTEIIDVVVESEPLDSFNTNQVVFWAGACIQAPHHGVRQLMRNIPSGVYCSASTSGSPSRQYVIGITNFITHVNEQPTPDLDSFLKVVRTVEDNTYCKLRIVSFDNVPFAQTLKVNYHYYPTVEFKKDANGDWKEQEHKP
ncbi:unnamed protein product [Kuraishia capsulata CBS 1993]|uniref:Pro-apoptotic serine protease NMA111 n=1 Tax=Kuraishia capsulata CBS 1993 TaxID=1382522 RepID=W6MSJ5_9ASCO|nr:uncharacterized protein KUCA_T00005677001 [Kuraishia capsulata CBS 1993]CDK29684.1 unnamed protein product [Kuraishia capsulata CBS 1993]